MNSFNSFIYKKKSSIPFIQFEPFFIGFVGSFVYEKLFQSKVFWNKNQPEIKFQ